MKILLTVAGLYSITIAIAETLVNDGATSDTLNDLAKAPSIGGYLPCCAGLADLGIGIGLIWFAWK